MQAIDQLLVLAQVSVVLAGFAGIIATFQFDKLDGIFKGQVLTLTMILVVSFSCLFCSLLSLALYNFGLTEPIVWMVSSSFGGVLWLASTIWVLGNTRWVGTSSPHRIRNLAFCSLSLVQVGVLFLNAAGVFFEREFGPYFAAFIFGFIIICTNFSSLLLRPLWRSIRSNESSEPVAAATLRRTKKVGDASQFVRF